MSSAGGIYDDADINRTIEEEESYDRRDREISPLVEKRIILPPNASNEVYFVGLHWSVTDALMESLGRHFGEPLEISFLEEKTNGKSKGVCLIKFATKEQAYRAKKETEGQQITEESEKTRCYYPSELPSEYDQHRPRAHTQHNQRQRSPLSFSTDRLDDGPSRHKRSRDHDDSRYNKRMRAGSEDRHGRRY